MVDPGELVLFDCSADSNPPNSCVWISKNGNRTEVVMTGPRFEVNPHELAQAKKFVVRAFNNITQKEDEAQFTLVVANIGSGESLKCLRKGNISRQMEMYYASQAGDSMEPAFIMVSVNRCKGTCEFRLVTEDAVF